MSTGDMIIHAVTVGHRKITMDRAVYEQAVRDERLEYELDSAVSDMNEDTYLKLPDGSWVTYPDAEPCDAPEVLPVWAK